MLYTQAVVQLGLPQAGVKPAAASHDDLQIGWLDSLLQLVWIHEVHNRAAWHSAIPYWGHCGRYACPLARGGPVAEGRGRWRRAGTGKPTLAELVGDRKRGKRMMKLPLAKGTRGQRLIVPLPEGEG